MIGTIDAMTYFNKLDKVSNDPEVVEIKSRIYSEERESKEIGSALREKGYYEKLEQKLNKTKNVWKVAGGLGASAILYSIASSGVAGINYIRRKRSLEKELKNSN